MGLSETSLVVDYSEIATKYITTIVVDYKKDGRRKTINQEAISNFGWTSH